MVDWLVGPRDRKVLAKGSIPPPLKFNVRALTLLPPERSSHDGPAEPSQKVLDYLTQLSISARDAASGLITSSLIAGRRSEAEDHGDVAFWVGGADETRLAESLLESLHIILPSDVSLCSLFLLFYCANLFLEMCESFSSGHRYLEILLIFLSIATRIKMLIDATFPHHRIIVPTDLPHREPRRSTTHIAEHDQPRRAKRSHPNPFKRRHALTKTRQGSRVQDIDIRRGCTCVVHLCGRV